MSREYKSHWSEADKARVFELRKQKLTWMEIGAELGRSYTACRNQYKSLQKNPEYDKNGVRIPQTNILAKFGLNKEMVRRTLAWHEPAPEKRPTPQAAAALAESCYYFGSEHTVGGRKSALDAL